MGKSCSQAATVGHKIKKIFKRKCTEQRGTIPWSDKGKVVWEPDEGEGEWGKPGEKTNAMEPEKSVL